MEQEKNRRDQLTKRNQKRNHRYDQRRLRGYKAELFKFNPEPTLEYYVTNDVANGWINIEDDEHPLYCVKGKSSLYALVFNKKVQYQLILYLKCQVSTRNLSSNIVNLKELWNKQILKSIQFIFHPNLMYSRYHFLKEVEDYFTNRIISVK